MVSETEVKTVEQARNLSLSKWNKVKELHEKFFDEVDLNCGFCDLSKYRLKNKGKDSKAVMGCELCDVQERCLDIQREASNLETKTRRLINRTIKFLEDMDVIEDE